MNPGLRRAHCARLRIPSGAGLLPVFSGPASGGGGGAHSMEIFFGRRPFVSLPLT
jgi:hypothetical protein